MAHRRREEFVYKPGEAVPRDVTRVVIPGSVRVVPEEEAFYDNPSLEEVVFEEGVAEVGQFAFCDCKLLRHLHLPSTLLRINMHAFHGCTSLRELNLPEGITEIGTGAFSNLSSLERVRLPSNLNVINEETLSYCTSLREVIFPERIRSIRGRAFRGCESLESIVLPSTLNAIGHMAFGDCLSLRTVELRGGIQTILHQAFDNCDLLDCIRVPCTALVITGNGEGLIFSLVKDGFTPQVSHNKQVIASECFNSILSAEMSEVETAIVRVLGEEFMQSMHFWQEDSEYDEWDEKCQRLRALLAPHERRHKAEIASLLELRLWKTEMENVGYELDSRTRAECRPARGVEMVQENVLSFLHFL